MGIILLFPSIWSAIHSLEHLYEPVCTDHDTLHLHEVEHSCPECDHFLIFTSFELHESPVLKIYSFRIDRLFSEPAGIPSISRTFQVLRGPPMLG